MQPDNINAVGLILMAVFTICMVLIFGKNPLNIPDRKAKIISSIGAGFLCWFLLALILAKSCIEAPDFGYHLIIPSISIACFALFIDRSAIILISCLLVFLAAGILGARFNKLVHFSDGYTAIDLNTHKPMAKGCSDMKSADGIITVSMWHSPLTGIYKIKKYLSK